MANVHTQGKWEVWQNPEYENKVRIKAKARGRVCDTICVIGEPGIKLAKVDRANAARIVLCVNSHDELLAMVQRFANAITDRKLEAVPKDAQLALAHCDACALLDKVKKGE